MRLLPSPRLRPSPARSRRSRRSLLLPAALLVILPTTLAACSDDSGSSDPGSSDSNADSADGAGGGEDAEGTDATGESGPAAPEVRRCRVAVEATGGAEASWEGRGEVRLTFDGDEPSATYAASRGDDLVRMYSADDDIPYAAMTFSQGDLAFTSLEDDADELEVETDGSGARAQLALTGLEDDPADVDVEFTCGGGEGGRDRDRDAEED